MGSMKQSTDDIGERKLIQEVRDMLGNRDMVDEKAIQIINHIRQFDTANKGCTCPSITGDHYPECDIKQPTPKPSLIEPLEDKVYYQHELVSKINEIIDKLNERQSK